MRNLLRIVLLVACSAPLVSAADLNIPDTIPEGLGVNIHFTDPKPGEMAMVAGGGFRFVRMDFDWAAIEKQKGVYDFSAYERLLEALEPHGIRALFILDYANPLYDDNRSPDSDEGRKAFARWAAAGAKHFQGRRILWEMYNEPNIAPFWRPKPNTEDYIKLALEVGRAIREAAPEEIYIGPATSGVDLPFLEACFEAGLLEYWDAVSVHPYRQQDPETAAEDYRKLRLLIAKHAPEGKTIPILSGEWGYSSVWGGFDEARQAKMLARQWLFNLSQDIQLSIWYDWHDDGPDEKEPEHHFGTVEHAYHANREPVYDPKPAYLAAKTLASELRGFRFNKRLALDSPDDYMLLFDRGEEIKVVAWTRSRQPKRVRLPVSAGTFAVTSHLGEVLTPGTADAGGLSIELADAPVYLAPAEPNDQLRLAAAWERAPLELEVRTPGDATVTLALPNPLDRSLHVSAHTGEAPAAQTQVAAGETIDLRHVRRVRRGLTEGVMLLQLDIRGIGTLAQRTHLVNTNPLTITIQARLREHWPVLISNPSGEPLSAFMTSRTSRWFHAVGELQDFELKAGETSKHVLLEGPEGIGSDNVSVELEGPDDDVIARASGTFITLEVHDTPAKHLRLVAEGDEDVPSEQSFREGDAPPGLPAPADAIGIDYRFGAGWKYVCLKPQGERVAKVFAKPSALGLWVKGDGSGNIVRMRFTDSTGQTFQPDGPKLTFTDWRYVEFPLSGEHAGHWGGANDGVIHYPIKLETIFLLDNATRQETAGRVYISSPVMVYQN